jgi:hypothetical protein
MQMPPDPHIPLQAPRWRARIAVLLVLAVPAFTGFPLDRLPQEIVAGIRWSWVLYWLLVQVAVLWLTGFAIYTRIAALTALVTVPVVYAGAAVSWVWLQLVPGPGGLAAAAIHYVRLCLNMLTVVPLALAMVVAVPFGSFERRLLMQAQGVSPLQKKALMALRVFNHIAFTVIPDILEVLREEQFGAAGNRPRFKDALRDVIHLAVQGICAALQYIPLWAHEIARLPDRRPSRKQ